MRRQRILDKLEALNQSMERRLQASRQRRTAGQPSSTIGVGPSSGASSVGLPIHVAPRAVDSQTQGRVTQMTAPTTGFNVSGMTEDQARTAIRDGGYRDSEIHTSWRSSPNVAPGRAIDVSVDTNAHEATLYMSTGPQVLYAPQPQQAPVQTNQTTISVPRNWLPLALVVVALLVAAFFIWKNSEANDRIAALEDKVSAAETQVAQPEADTVTQEDLASAVAAALQSGGIPRVSTGDDVSLPAALPGETGTESESTLPRSNVVPDYEVVRDSAANLVGVNGKKRRASGSCDNCAEAFVSGEQVVGYSILDNNRNIVCDGGNCFIQEAWFAGSVIDGVVNPDDSDLRSAEPLRLVEP